MRRVIVITVLFSTILVVLATSSACAQWIRLGEDVSAGQLYVTSLANRDSGVFAAISKQGDFEDREFQGIFQHGKRSAWDQTDDGFTGGSAVYAMRIFGENVIAADWNVHCSTNGGKSWIMFDTILANYGHVTSFASIGTTVYASRAYFDGCSGDFLIGGVFASQDSGQTWSHTDERLIKSYHSSVWTNDSVHHPPIFSLATIGNALFAGGYAASRSTDLGLTWISINNGLPPGRIEHLTACGTDLFAVLNDYAYPSHLFHSSDSGNSWSEVSVGVGHILCLSSNDSLLLIGTVDSGLFRSTDKGQTWAQVSDGLPQTSISSLLMTTTTLYAGTGNAGVWQRPLSEIQKVIGVKRPIALHQSVENQTATEVSLSPNPTTGIVVVRGGPEVRRVTITNVLGEPLLTLAGPQSTDVSIDFSKFPSGTYVARIVTDKGVVTRKIIKK